MKISIILKPRGSWISQSLNNYYSMNYNQWKGEITSNLLIDRVPVNLLENLIKEYRNIESPYNLIFWVSIEKGISEFKRIEKLLLNS